MRDAWIGRVRRGAMLAVAALFAVGCGAAESGGEAAATSGGEALDVAANTNAPAPELEAGAGTVSARRGSGRTPEDPIIACGPLDSYVYVAREFECPGGGNPLNGDPDQGARARIGNVGANSEGHVIDHYQVPCPGGPVDIYVDMYGCPEYQQVLP
jgi:hypothetical protein